MAFVGFWVIACCAAIAFRRSLLFGCRSHFAHTEPSSQAFRLTCKCVTEAHITKSTQRRGFATQLRPMQPSRSAAHAPPPSSPGGGSTL